MKSWILKVSMLTSLLTLVGCVEFKNPEDESAAPEPQVAVQSESWLIDKPLYFHEGKIKTAEEIDFTKDTAEPLLHKITNCT